MPDMAYVAYCGWCKGLALVIADPPHRRVETFWELHEAVDSGDQIQHVIAETAKKLLQEAVLCQCPVDEEEEP